MTAGSQRAALDAIHSARPIIARLSMSRDKEDLAADLIEAWTATENGLRSLIGGSSLGGQALIRELRQRHFLSLDQANALAEFFAARERASRVDYTVTEGDVNASREAFVKLEAGLMGDATTAAAPGTPAPAPPEAARPKAAAYTPGGPLDPSARERFEGTPTAVPPEPARSSWIAPAMGLVALLAVGAIAWYAVAGRNRGRSALNRRLPVYSRKGR